MKDEDKLAIDYTIVDVLNALLEKDINIKMSNKDEIFKYIKENNDLKNIDKFLTNVKMEGEKIIIIFESENDKYEFILSNIISYSCNFSCNYKDLFESKIDNIILTEVDDNLNLNIYGETREKLDINVTFKDISFNIN